MTKQQKQELERALELIGFVSVAKLIEKDEHTDNVPYQTISKFARGGKLRSQTTVNNILNFAVKAAYLKMDELGKAVETIETWKRTQED